MSLVSEALPAGVVPTLGPDATGVGHVFWYTVESPTRSLQELRTPAGLVRPLPAQRRAGRRGSRVGRRLRPAVPDRRRSRTACAATACRSARSCARCSGSNANVGGNVIESNGAWPIVRGVGLIESVARSGGRRAARQRRPACPCTWSRSPTCTIGDAFRTASLVKGTKEAVGGVVVARIGRQPTAGHRRRQGADRADPAGPAGRRHASCRSTTARSSSIRPIGHAATSRSSKKSCWSRWRTSCSCMHFRSILIVTLPLPLAVLMSFLMMQYARRVVEHHEPRGHRDRHRRPGRRGHRRHRERVPLRSNSEGMDPRDRRAVSRRSVRVDAAGRRARCSSRWRSSCWPSSRCSR